MARQHDPSHPPYVDPVLLAHLENIPEWKDQAPSSTATWEQVQRLIGAVSVIRYLRELVEDQVSRDMD